MVLKKSSAALDSVSSSSNVGMHSLRGRDVVSDHTVVYVENGERLELAHKAAIWASNRSPGLYNMENVLGLE